MSRKKFSRVKQKTRNEPSGFTHEKAFHVDDKIVSIKALEENNKSKS